MMHQHSTGVIMLFCKGENGYLTALLKQNKVKYVRVFLCNYSKYKQF